MRTDVPFRAGAEIYLRDADNNSLLSVFYLSKPGFSGGACEITAYDNCRALDRIFDTSGYFSNERDYPASELASAAAVQCGFGGVVNYDPEEFTVPYKYVKGTSCRRLLDILSEAECGIWFCNHLQQLEFKRFGTISEFFTVTDGICTDFRIGAVKGPVASLQVSNPVTGENYRIGYSDYFTDILKVSGKLIDNAAAHKIFENVSGKEYRAFSCKRIRTEWIPSALCGFYYGGVCYSASSIITDITPSGFYSSVKAPIISEDRFDYVGTMEYSITDRIMQEKKYGCSFISFSGLRFSDGGNSYGFTMGNGGMTFYDGVMSSKKSVENISVDKDAGTVTCTFDDGHTYQYHAEVTETANGYDISNEGDEWT